MTGFERFGDGLRNPSQVVAEALHGHRVAGRPIHGLVLPCRFKTAAALLRRTIRKLRPELVICLGLAEKRREITPESRAWNWIDARIPDNAGRLPRRQRVRLGGPLSCRSSLPVARITAALRKAGLPARVSRSAGRFVCNEVFYHLMSALDRDEEVRGGFIHLPPLASGRPRLPGLALARQLRGVRIAIEVSLAGRSTSRKV